MAHKFEVGETVLITKNSRVVGHGEIVYIGRTLIEIVNKTVRKSEDFCAKSLVLRARDGKLDFLYKICKMVNTGKMP